MALRERYQSPTLGDQINLDLYNYQNNALDDLYDIQKIEVYFLNTSQISDHNPDGRRIKETILPVNISSVTTGHYRTVVTLEDTTYEIGDHLDIWYVKFNSYDEEFIPIVNNFVVYTDLRETHDRPFVYSVDFEIHPKKIVKGSKQYIKINFRPQIDSVNLLERFYYNIKTTSNLYVRIELTEGCGYHSGFPEMNLMTDPEWKPAEIRGDNEAYLLVDTTDTGDYELGIYSVQAKIVIDDQEIISPRFWMQIFD